MADWHIWWLDVDSGIPVVAFKGGRESGGPLFGVGGSSYPDLGEVSVMSNDGQTLAFSLTVTNDTIPGHRISLWTPKSGLKTLDESAMTLPPGGAEPMTSKWPLLSPDGRKLAFVTQDAVPSAGVTEGGTLRLFVRTLATGRTVALPEADYGWAYPEFSPDGSKLLFQTVSTLGFEGDRNEDLDVFVVDTETGNPTLVSTLPNTAASVTPSKLSGAPRLSVDGRYVFYASMADDLVVGDTNGVWDIFRYDRRTGETKGVSTFPNGVPGGAKALLDVSPNGRLVLFSSFQPGFAEGDTNGLADGFLKDMETGVLTLVSVFDPNRPESGISPVISGRMSDDGRFIVYDQDVGSGQISTLRDLVGGQSWVLTRSRSPDEMPRVSNYMPSLISADGKVVTFVFRTETNGVWSYLRDSDEMRAIDESKPKSEVSFVNQLNVSRNGRWIAYEDGLRNKASLGLTLRVKDLVMHTSRAIPLGDFSTRDLELSDTGGLVFSTAAPLPGSADDNRLKDVFFYDFNADLLWLVSRSSGGRAGVGGESGSPRISRDGRYIVFRSSATNLIDGDVNGTADIFIHDSASDTITLLSGDAQGTGPGNGPSYGPAISADAGVVAFFSQADNMAANDFNGLPDIFAVEPKRIDPLPLKPVRLSASGSRWARFQWWSNSGTRYVVRATSNLASGDWKQVGPELVGTGGTLVFDEPRDPNRFTPPARFYQVIEVR